MFIEWLNSFDTFTAGKIFVFTCLAILIVAHMVSCAKSKMPDNKEK